MMKIAITRPLFVPLVQSTANQHGSDQNEDETRGFYRRICLPIRHNQTHSHHTAASPVLYSPCTGCCLQQQSTQHSIGASMELTQQTLSQAVDRPTRHTQ